MKDLIYKIEKKRIKLKSKYYDEDVYVDFEKNIIFVRGRPFAERQDFVNNKWLNSQMTREAYILFKLYEKNKNTNSLSISHDTIKYYKKD